MDSDLAKNAYIDALIEKLQVVPLHLAFDLKNATLDRINFSSPSSLDVYATVGVHRGINWRLIDVLDVYGQSLTSFRSELPYSSIDHDELASLKQSVVEHSTQLQISDALVLRPPSEFLLWRPPWATRFDGRLFALPAKRAAQLPLRSIIFGSPGSGKSIAMRQIALELAKSKRVPVFIECGEKWFRAGFTAKNRPPTGRELLKLYLENTFPEQLSVDVLDWIDSCRQAGNIAFLFDAVDEASPSDEKTKKEFLTSFSNFLRSIGRINTTKIIVSCRPEGFELLDFQGFFPVRMRPLTASETTSLVKSLFNTTAAGADAAFSGTIGSILALPEEIRSSALFVFILFVISNRRSGVLPDRRVDLIDEIVDALLDHWATTKLRDRSLTDLLGRSKKQIRAVMRSIAVTAILAEDDEEESAGRVHRQHIFEACFAKSVDMEFVFEYLSHVAGLLRSQDGKEFRFVHRTIQEFLIAEELFLNYKVAGEFSEIVKNVDEARQRWGEPIRLLGELLVKDRRESELLDFVSALIDFDHAADRIGRVKKYSRLKLACDLIKLRPRPGNWVHMRDRVVADAVCKLCHTTIKMRSLTDLAIRKSITEFMSEYKDWRPGVGGVHKKGFPDINWIRIEAGLTQIGLSSEDEELLRSQGILSATTQGLSRERPSFKVDVPGFWIAKFPITHAQFLQFVEAFDGYRSEVWWRGMVGRRFGPSEIDRWRLLTYSKKGSHPIAGVSWLEATAFCRWLSDRRGEKIKLPTEIEWEVAARGPKSFLFPWGNEWHPNRCNWAGLGIGDTLPVGTFPSKVATWEGGPEDMLGNVWEWCVDSAQDAEGTLVAYPNIKFVSPDEAEFKSDTFRVVRGGSYVNNASVMRSTFRGRDVASSRLERQGFRVIRRD